MRTEVLREYELPGHQGRLGLAAATLSNAQQVADATHEHLLVPLLTLLLGPNSEDITLEFNRMRDICQPWVRRIMGAAAEINNAIRFANLNRGGRKPVLYVWRSIPKFSEFNADEQSCKNKREIDAAEEDGDRLIVSMSIFPALYAYESVKVSDVDPEPDAVRQGERGTASRASNPAASKAENHQRPPLVGDGPELSTILEESSSQVGGAEYPMDRKGEGRTTLQSPSPGQIVPRSSRVKQMAKKTSKVVLRDNTPLSNKENDSSYESDDSRGLFDYIRERAAVRRLNVDVSPKVPKGSTTFSSQDGVQPNILSEYHATPGRVVPRGGYLSRDRAEDKEVDNEVEQNKDEVIDQSETYKQVGDDRKDDRNEDYEIGDEEESDEETEEEEGDTDGDYEQTRSRRSSSPSPEPFPYTPPMQIRGGGGPSLRIRGGADTHVPGTLDEEPTQSEYGPPSEVISLPSQAARRPPRRTAPNDVYARPKSYDSSTSTRLSDVDGRSERTGSTVQKPAPVVHGPLRAAGPSRHGTRARSSSPPIPPGPSGPSGPPLNPDVPTDLVPCLLETMVSRAQVLLVWSPPPDVPHIVSGPINHNVYNATVPRTTRYMNAIAKAKSTVLETFSRARVSKAYKNIRRSTLPKDPVVHDTEAKFIHHGPLLRAISKDLQRRDLARASGDPRLYASLVRRCRPSYASLPHRYRQPYGWLRHHWEGVEEISKVYGALMALAVAYGWAQWYLETDLLTEIMQNPRVAGWKYLRRWATGLG